MLTANQMKQLLRAGKIIDVDKCLLDIAAQCEPFQDDDGHFIRDEDGNLPVEWIRKKGCDRIL
jgi:hypothetical protein